MKKNDYFFILAIIALFYYINKEKNKIVKEAPEPQKLSGFSDNIGIF
jgi:hypothetical protein